MARHPPGGILGGARHLTRDDDTKAHDLPITDIIPDIHGQAAKLHGALHALGWRRGGLGWSHPEPDRRLLFLGDFIDRGPENAAVLRTLRDLVDTGRARAIMGNHELNALHFHTPDPDTGLPLRPRDDRNTAQHAAFLREFPPDAPATHEALAWMRSLPLFLETPDLRAVHAAWIAPAVDGLRHHSPDAVLTDDQLIRAGRKDDPLCDLAATLTKGPEHPLPQGHAFRDGAGHLRHEVRVKWWNGTARTWRDAAMSVPDPGDLPDTPLPATLVAGAYPPTAPPVVFGHYWLTGDPVLQAPNALCLDYSAGTHGPLVTYSHDSTAPALHLSKLTVHGPMTR